MNPIKVGSDVQTIIEQTFEGLARLQARADEIAGGLRRVIAQIYDLPIDQADYLRFAQVSGDTFVLDIRTHNAVGNAIVPVAPPDAGVAVGPGSVEIYE
jgi:hypothetical protein